MTSSGGVEAAQARATDYRLALRDDDTGDLDDVVVKDVSMFRAERMSTKELWMACCFPGTDQRITFWVRSKKGQLEFGVTEQPHGDGFVYEDALGGAGQDNTSEESAT